MKNIFEEQMAMVSYNVLFLLVDSSLLPMWVIVHLQCVMAVCLFCCITKEEKRNGHQNHFGNKMVQPLILLVFGGEILLLLLLAGMGSITGNLLLLLLHCHILLLLLHFKFSNLLLLLLLCNLLLLLLSISFHATRTNKNLI